MADRSIPTWSDFALEPADCACPELRRQIECLYVPALGPTGDRLYDLGPFRRQAPLVNGAAGLGFTPSEEGWALHFDAAAHFYANPYVELTAPYTIWCRLRIVNPNLYGGIVAYDATNAICARPTGKITWWYPANHESSALSMNVWHDVAVVVQANRNWQYVLDGRPDLSFPGAPSLTILRIGADSASERFGGEIGAVAAWSRAMPIAALGELHHDPLCMLRRRRRRRSGKASPAVGAPYRVAVAQTFQPGAAAGGVFAAAAQAGQTFHAGQAAGMVATDC